MKITRIACALLGNSPVVRVVTDAGLDGFGQVESSRPFVATTIPMVAAELIGEDPTDVERCMVKIRRLGAFKPWGSAVSAIEVALWDLLGKATNLPVHKLLGGKVRDRVRVYNGGVRTDLGAHMPEDYARAARFAVDAPEGFTIIKEGVGYHGFMSTNVPGFMLGDPQPGPRHPNQGPLTNKGLRHLVECVAAIRGEIGPDVGLALDIGPGHTLADSVRILRALEPFDIMWAEDLLTGDYTPWVHPEQYLELTRSTTVPTHTGEQIYSRHNFRRLLETGAVRVIGPDPLDVGGLAELKWVAELADLHGVQIAPHGVLDGVLGFAALVQVCATLPSNFVAFEYPVPEHSWWYDIVDGVEPDAVRAGFAAVSERPGLGVTFKTDEARRYLRPEDADFFDWS